MMMIGDPTVQIPSYNQHYDDATAHIQSPIIDASFAALHRYLPSNTDDDFDSFSDDFDFPSDAFSCDHFRMFEFKVKKCSRARSHDWTECPFAHPGEKARRRDPRKHHYSGTACPEFRKGLCKRGDSCEFAHGVFECWLHPARYRTQPCKDGIHCRRRICFFAHTPDQLRVLANSDEDSPSRLSVGDSFFVRGSFSPPSSDSSPPVSPLSQLAESMRVKMSLGMGLSVSPPSWRRGIGSPRSPVRAGFTSLPTTPFKAVTRSGLGGFDSWCVEEEQVMERVESGRALRERIYEKIGKENSLDRAGRAWMEPDVGWVSDLVN